MTVIKKFKVALSLLFNRRTFNAKSALSNPSSNFNIRYYYFGIVYAVE